MRSLKEALEKDLTGRVATITLDANRENLEQLEAIGATMALSDSDLAAPYIFALEKVRRAMGHGYETCDVSRRGFIGTFVREGGDETRAEDAWRRFCRPFVC